MTQRKSMWRAMCALIVGSVVASSCVFVQRVSVTSAGGQGFDDSWVAEVSADGRYVLFESEEQFSIGDTNSHRDVYLRDTLLGATTLISANFFGVALNGDSYDPSMSSDATVFAYTTDATDVAGGYIDLNNEPDVVLLGTGGFPVLLGMAPSGGVNFTAPNGASTNADVSDNGTVVAWESTATNVIFGDTNGVSDVFRSTVGTVSWERVSVSDSEQQADGGSHSPDASFNGSRIAFSSDATNLIAGGENNGLRDIYRRNGGSTELISRDVNGFLANGDSDHPRTVALGTRVSFESTATDLVSGDTNGIRDVFLWNNGPISRVSVADNGSQLTAGPGHTLEGIGGTEPRVLWGDGQGSYFIRDVLDGVTDLVSADKDGVGVTATGAALALGGDYVGFSTSVGVIGGDTNGVSDVYLRAYPNPIVTAVSPSAAVGTTTTVTITGERLGDVTALLSSIQLSWSNLVAIDDSTLQADVTVVASATPGLKGVSVLTPDGGPGQYSGAFATCNCLLVIA